MKKNNLLLAIGGVTALLSIGLLAANISGDGKSSSELDAESKRSKGRAAEVQKVAPKKMSHVLKRLEVENRARAEKKLQAIQEAETALSETGGYTSKQLEFAREHVNEMVAVAGTIYTPKLRSESMGKLAKDPKMVKLLSDVLTDIDFAKSAFGPDQGKMRHFAIETLGHVAKTGDSEPLENALAQVTSNLTAKEGEVERGEIEDLSGLVMALAKNTPEGRLTGDLVAELGYSVDAEKEVRDAWVNSLFIGSWKRSGSLEDAREVASRVFSKG